MNTEQKHTPGPWCWDDKDALPWTDYDKTDHMPYLINANGRIVMSGDDIRIRNKADGHLMIAAPDLLAALKVMVDKFESEIINEYDGTTSLSERLKQADFARAAIAKAEGKA